MKNEKDIMHTLRFFLLIMFYGCPLLGNSWEIHAEKKSKMPLHIGTIGQEKLLLTQLGRLLVENLACPHERRCGFSVSFSHYDTVCSQRKLYEIAQQQSPLILFLNQYDKSTFEWRLYEVSDMNQSRMIMGKRIYQLNRSIENIAHEIAEVVWKVLTGYEHTFSSYIAYCKERIEKNGKKSYHLCIQHPFSFKKEMIIVDNPSIKFSPRWFLGQDGVKLFYSEYTPINVRIMSTNLQGKRTISVNMDGLNMTPSFSSGGDQVILCSSCEGSSQLYRGILSAKNNKWLFGRITKNTGNNFSPILRDNGDIIFCSDFEIKKPQIYYYEKESQQITRLTNTGYCTSPCYSEKTNHLVYSKFVGGILQLFSYDFATEKHIQLTDTQGNKEEASFSPCGMYLAFSVNDGTRKRIAIFNTCTREQYFLTPPSLKCAYPCWSPRIYI